MKITNAYLCLGGGERAARAVAREQALNWVAILSFGVKQESSGAGTWDFLSV